MELIKFEQDSCVPCQILDNILEELDVTVDKKVNPMIDPQTAIQFGVMSTPQLILFDKGVEIDRVIGIDRVRIENLLEKYSK